MPADYEVLTQNGNLEIDLEGYDERSLIINVTSPGEISFINGQDAMRVVLAVRHGLLLVVPTFDSNSAKTEAVPILLTSGTDILEFSCRRPNDQGTPVLWQVSEGVHHSSLIAIS